MSHLGYVAIVMNYAALNVIVVDVIVVHFIFVKIIVPMRTHVIIAKYNYMDVAVCKYIAPLHFILLMCDIRL